MSEHVEGRSERRRGNPHKMRLPGFINDEEIGLGDVIRRATSTVGIKPCGACNERAKHLNDWMVFSARRQADL